MKEQFTTLEQAQEKYPLGEGVIIDKKEIKTTFFYKDKNELDSWFKKGSIEILEPGKAQLTSTNEFKVKVAGYFYDGEYYYAMINTVDGYKIMDNKLAEEE